MNNKASCEYQRTESVYKRNRVIGIKSCDIYDIRGVIYRYNYAFQLEDILIS